MPAIASRLSDGSVSARLRPFLTGLPWLALLAAVTVVLVIGRGHIDKVHAALGYLLVVLVASSRSGRGWGLATAVLAFLCFDFFLVPPYLSLSVEHQPDWIVLGSFLITGIVAAQLFDRAKREAREAQARTEEVDRFSVVGAEALNGGRAEQGPEALARILRETLQVKRCEIYLFEAPDKLRLVASATGGGGAGADFGGMPESPDGTDLLHYVARYRALAVQRPTGDVHVEPSDGHLSKLLAELPGSLVTLIPLTVRERTVGVVSLVGGGRPLDAAQIRFVEALAYYAALGVERVRLVAQEERAGALREADRLKDALLAAVSHELRTPLTTIKAVAHELRSREEGAAVIEAEADRLNRFVADLLDLSRLDSGSVTMRPEIVPADDLIGAALRQLSAGAAACDIRAQVPPNRILFCRIDFVLAQRCLVNILENAVRYCARGPVQVTAALEGSMVMFAVADCGPGVPDDEVELVFESFYRGRGVPAGSGTGLGLSIARRLARAQGGDVRYAPRPGGGSIFTLALPAADVPEDASAEAGDTP